MVSQSVEQTIISPSPDDMVSLQQDLQAGDLETRGVVPDGRSDSRGEVRQQQLECEQARLRRQLDVRGKKSCARSIYFETVARLHLTTISLVRHAQLLQFLIVVFARGWNDLSNAFPGDPKLIEWLQLGQGSKNKKRPMHAARVALERLKHDAVAVGLLVLHDLGYQAALPSGVVGVAWFGPTDWGNRSVVRKRKRRRVIA